MLVRVIAAVIEREGRFLACQRPAHKRHGGLWEFPGGKCESGESDLDAARRELREELGVDVVGVGPPIFSIRDDGSPFLIAFIPAEIAGEPRALEHSRLDWYSSRELSRLTMAPSDRAFLEWHFGGGNIALRKS